MTFFLFHFSAARVLSCSDDGNKQHTQLETIRMSMH